MAGISSKALNNAPENRTRFQGQEFANKEFSDGSGLDWYEFKYRMHDPQIGRFLQIDPLADEYEYNSPYAFSENKVIVHREIEGLEAEYIFGKAWKELADDFRSLGRSIDKAITYVTSWGGSTENASKTIGNTTITNSTTVSVSTETSTNFEGNFDYIIRNNTSVGNPEPMTKTNTTIKITDDQKVEVKTSKSTVTNKTSIDAVSGNVSTENSVKVNRKGIDVGGSITSNSNGTVSGKVEASVGKSTKGKANATLTSGSNGTNLQIQVGTEKKIGKQTINQSAGIKINF
jgi:RHS repeat-associated protein